jgi:hypothetical protein
VTARAFQHPRFTTASNGPGVRRLVRGPGLRGLASLAALATAVYLAAPAAAAPLLATPTGVHVAAASSTSFTVAANPVAHARKYRVFASATKSDVYARNLGSSRPSRHLVSSRTPSVTISGLKYTTAVYYYRIQAKRQHHLRMSPIFSATLRPATPTALHLTNDSTGTYLTWSSGAVTGFTLAQSTDPSMTANRLNYTIRGQSTQFTPPDLTKGTTYYFRVRANNGSSVSLYSTQVSASAATSEQPVTVMTYNVMTDVRDGTSPGGGETITPWNSKRKPAVVSLVRQADADVISIQEGGGWVTATQGFGGSRQVDSLATDLAPHGYTLADTEIPPSQHNYFRTGNYIIYRNTSYQAVGAGGHWFLDGTISAAYQMLQNKSTGATFLFVAPHTQVGSGASYDKKRESQTQTLVTQARAAAGGHRIIYAGDFNSYLSRSHQYDGPGRVMHAAHIADGLLVAPSLTNQQFNSANQYLRTPPQDSNSIDHVFAEPGVGLRTWSELLNVSNGRLVGTIPSDHNPVVSVVTVPY